MSLRRRLTGSDWPLRMRFWHWLHVRIGDLAWRYARPDGPEWGIALRIDRSRLLWRLNDWAARHWIDWYLADRANR